MSLTGAPPYALADNDLGVRLREEGEIERALAAFERALGAYPDFLEARINLGLLLADLQRPQEAEWQFAVALRSGRASARMLTDIGAALYQLGRRAEAQSRFNDALALEPECAEAHVGLGAIAFEARKLDVAERRYRRVLARDSSHVEANLHMAFLELLRGDYEPGWRHYEHRLSRRGALAGAPDAPIWTGRPLDGRSILVMCEQGFGDCLQFVRYLPLLATQGARPTLGAPAPLAGLFRQSLPGVEVIDASGPFPSCDEWAPLLSLPRLVGTRLESIPAAVPYLKVDPKRALAWRTRLGDAPSLRVGIAWRGNPRNVAYPARSMSAREIAAIVAATEGRVVSLQADAGADEIAALGPKVMDAGPALSDFAETAALVANLDAVVSVDTAAAHLAGALGVPTLLLLSAASDWRWLEKRSDSPWYPTATLVRQRRLGDWTPVALAAKRWLAEAAERRGGRRTEARIAAPPSRG